MSSTVGTASGMKGKEISRLSGVFLFCPTMDVPTSVASAPSSSLGESGRSVMSSTWTSSRDWDGLGSSVSVGLVISSGLGFETPFLAPEALPYLSSLHCGELFLNPCQATRLWLQSGHVLELDYGLGLYPFLVPLTLSGDPDKLA
jgi:hypothetical protein